MINSFPLVSGGRFYILYACAHSRMADTSTVEPWFVDWFVVGIYQNKGIFSLLRSYTMHKLEMFSVPFDAFHRSKYVDASFSPIVADV